MGGPFCAVVGTEWVHAGRRNIVYGIERGLVARGLAEPGLRVVVAGDGLIEDAETAANRGLVVNPVRKTDAGRTVGPIRIGSAAREAVQTGKSPHSVDGGWSSRIRVFRIRGIVRRGIRIPGRENLRAERIHSIDVELRTHAVVPLPVRKLDVPTQADVQRQSRVHLPVVLEIQAVVRTRQVIGCVDRLIAAGGHAHQQGGDAVERLGRKECVAARLAGEIAKCELAVSVTRSDIALGFIVNFAADAECVSPSGQRHAGKDLPGVVGRPAIAAAGTEECASETTDVDFRHHRAGYRGGRLQSRHPQGRCSDGLRLRGVGRRQLDEAEPVELNIEYRRGRNDVRLIHVDTGKGAVVVTISSGHWRREGGRGAVFKTVELAE